MERRLLPDMDPALAAEMHFNMRVRERDLPSYYMKSPFLYQRRSIVQLIYSLGEAFGLNEDTVFTAVAYFDHFSDSVDIPMDGLNLAAMACVLLAAKWEEREEDVPLLSHLVRVCGDRYSVKELQIMEMVILDFMSWNLTTVVPSAFLAYYARHATAATDGVRFMVPSLSALEALVHDRALFFLSHATLDFTTLNYPPSVLAASAVVAARTMLGVTPGWAPGLLSASGFAEADLMECVQRLWSMAGKAPPALPLQQQQQPQPQPPQMLESPATRHDMAVLTLAAPAPPLAWDQCV